MTTEEKKIKNNNKQKAFRDRIKLKMDADPEFAKEIREQRAQYQRRYQGRLREIVKFAREIKLNAQ